MRSGFIFQVFLCIFWTAGFEAIPTESNVDTLEPTVIRSPALGVDPEDGFGWATTFHQVEEVQNGDTMSDVLRKTR